MSKTMTTLFAFALCASGSATAFAQDEAEQEEGVVELSADTNTQVGEPVGPTASPRGPLSVYGGLRLGFGGNLHTEIDDTGFDGDDDMLATIGLQGGADYILMDYFAVGGELRLAWLNSETRDDGDIGRDLFIDIAVKPRGRYAFNNIPLEVYGAMPLGITFIATNGDIDDNTNGDVSQGPGFNLGFLAGATYFFTDHMGINGEMGGLMYWYGADFDAPAGKFSSSNRIGQFNLFANFVYAL
jgi:hypothetical protein